MFDLETARTTKEVQNLMKLPDERSAFGYPHQMNFAVGVLWDSKEGEFYGFRDAKMMAQHLLSFKGLLVSYNGIRFDIPVLLPYIDIDDFFALQKIPHLDMMAEFYKNVNGRFRVSLNNIAKETVNAEKSGSGADAPMLFKEGKFKELFDYCKQDVLVTKKVFEYGVKEGHILYQDRHLNRRVRMDVDWAGWVKDVQT